MIAAEVLVPPLAEERIEDRLAAAGSGARRVEANIRSFPLTTSVLLGGRMRRLDLTLHGVDRGELRFQTLRFELEDVEIDRGALLRGEPRARSIARGVVTAVLSTDAVLDAAGAPNLPQTAAALDTLRVSDGSLVIGGDGPFPELSVPLHRDLFPCEPAATVVGGRVRLRCTVEPVPGRLLRSYGVVR